jgi:hypothetical protein
MVNIKELMVGNWVSVFGRCTQIESLKIECPTLTELSSDDVISYEDIDPIPLTPEILIKCGYRLQCRMNYGDGEFDNYVMVNLRNPSFDIAHYLDSNKFVAERDMPVYCIKTLHHLQNIYFVMLHEVLDIEFP